MEIKLSNQYQTINSNLMYQEILLKGHETEVKYLEVYIHQKNIQYHTGHFKYPFF